MKQSKFIGPDCKIQLFRLAASPQGGPAHRLPAAYVQEPFEPEEIAHQDPDEKDEDAKMSHQKPKLPVPPLLGKELYCLPPVDFPGRAKEMGNCLGVPLLRRAFPLRNFEAVN